MNCIQLNTKVGVAVTNAPLSLLGLVLNALSILGFAQIIWHSRESNTSSVKTNMYKYLLIKAVFDLFCFIQQTVYLLWLCEESCHLHATPAFTYWYVYLYVYATQMFFFFSSLMEVAATLGKLTHN
jgi:hypothetical protein